MHQTARTFLLQSLGYRTENHSVLTTDSINYILACFTSSKLDELVNLDNWGSKNFDAYASYLDKCPFMWYALANLRVHYEDCDRQDWPSVLISQLVRQLIEHPLSTFIGNWIYSS